MPQFTVHTEDVGGSLVIRPVGELDEATAPTFRNMLLNLLDEQTGPIILDLGRVTFMDSSGLTAIVAAHQRAHHTGRYFSVAALSPPIARLFTLTNLDNVIHIRHHDDHG